MMAEGEEGGNIETVVLTFPELFGTHFCLSVSLSSSEVENLATAMLSAVSACSQCYMKVARSPISGFKPCKINMAL